MANNLILDSDYLVLQRRGYTPFDEPNPPTTGGPYPNLKYDLELFHFTGKDLRDTVTQYNKDSGDFVLVNGDNHMTGNLKIKYPETGNVEKGAPARVELTGFRTTTSEVCEVRMINRANSASGSVQKVAAVNPSGSTNDSYIKLNNRFSVTYDGKIYLGGRHICANDGDTGATNEGGGFLSYITNSQWSPTENIIKKTMESNIVRLRWTHYGGALKNSVGKDVLQWLNGEVRFHKPSSGDLIGSYDDTDMYTHGEISDDKSVTNKEYVDTQDGKYIPLGGTRDTVEGSQAQQHVNGPIDFIEGSYLNAKLGAILPLSYSDEHYIGIGGDPSGTSVDEKIHFNKKTNVHENEIQNVKYPEVPYDPDGTTREDSHAVPRRYVDDRDRGLQDQIDSIVGIQSPVGMINAYVGDEDPPGWFICNGRNIDELYAAKGLVGTQLKAVLGSDSLPNLSGSFLAQKKHSSGTDSNGVAIPDPIKPEYGENIGTALNSHLDEKVSKPSRTPLRIDIDQNGTHSHPAGDLSVKVHRQKMADKDNGSWDGAELMDPDKSQRNTQGTRHLPVDNRTGSDGFHKHQLDTNQFLWDSYNRPQTYSINWIIKADNG